MSKLASLILVCTWLVLPVHAGVVELIFSDGFESGDTDGWVSTPSIGDQITKSQLTLTATPFDLTTYTYRSHPHPQPWSIYAYAPRLVLATDESSTTALALHDVSAGSVVVVPMDGNLQPSGAELTVASGVSYLGGFDLTPTGYAVAWVSGSENELFTVAEANTSGTILWSTAITGTAPLEDTWSKQGPMDFGSGRVLFDAANNRVAGYLGHKMKWDDGIKHQGGLLKFLDRSGTILGDTQPWGEDPAGGNNWLYSHNFDQRIVIRGSKQALIGLGDAYPRAVAFREQVGTGSVTSLEIFPIPGSLGDNDTLSQLGGLAALPGGGYLAVFTTSAGRQARDVVAIPISAGLTVGSPVWLTSIASAEGLNAINAKVAVWGSSILVGWETVSPPNPDWVPTDDFTTYLVEVDASGNPVGAPEVVTNVRLPRGDDWITLPDGDVAWATGEGGQVNVYRVDVP